MDAFQGIWDYKEFYLVVQTIFISHKHFAHYVFVVNHSISYALNTIKCFCIKGTIKLVISFLIDSHNLYGNFGG